MSLGEKIEKSPLVKILLIISIIVSLIFTIVIIAGNRSKFDNAKLYGDFKGDLSFNQDFLGNYSLNITFDGKREFLGMLEINQSRYEIGSSYTCIGSNVDFSISLSSINIFFSFEGLLSDAGTFIEGAVRFYPNSNQIYNGSFLLTKYY